jgi:hypothetical protein
MAIHAASAANDTQPKTTSVETTAASLTVLMNELIERDFDAIGAYGAAIMRISNASDRLRFAAFRAEHARHVNQLTLLVRDLGGAPKTHANLKHVVTMGRVLFGSLLGDEAIIRAMKNQAIETNRAYEDAASIAVLPVNVRMLFDRNRDDERKHLAWIEERLVSAS